MTWLKEPKRGVIPVWNLEKKKLDPSVTHWDDKKGATRMTRKEHWDPGCSQAN
ncbi:hypothetical protein [Wolbachia endosymbiont of Aedes albopictus]|uniref:hypothetical protein n=1 Tax=Wolbachia endosymbiont of Aedes albopictus TaxID=167957 RepID=UPI0021694C3F|nr:hypothetical protein [Wolbachia endosymbiont of Aedes albopictus]